MILINPNPLFNNFPRNILTLHNKIPVEYLNQIKDKSLSLNYTVNDGLYNLEEHKNIKNYTPKSSTELEFNVNNIFYPLYKNLHDIILKTNKEYFNYNLNSFIGPLTVNQYNGNNSKLGWHSDIGDKEYSLRKLSIILMLSNPDEFEGGNLEIFVGENKESQNPIHTLTPKQGDIIIFPSYIPHKVTPVTQGRRLTVIGFMGNEKPFK